MKAIMSSSRVFLTQRTNTIASLRCVLQRNPNNMTHRPQVMSAAAMFSSTPHVHSKVGFIGLGNMGLKMAINLAKEKHVLAFDLNQDACQEAASSQPKEESSGIEIAQSIQDIGALSVQDCPVIITMLPGCAAVDSVMEILKEATCHNNSRPNNNSDDGSTESSSRVILDCSTVSPTTSRKWHEIWQQQGHAMLDAPVSGGVKGATDGTLTFMVGCGDADDDNNEEQHLERALPYLNIMGQRVMHCGKSGTGSATKLCNNLALAAQMLGVCEALNLGEALGVDPIVLADVMNTSTAKCWSSQVNNPHPAVATAAGAGSPASKDYQGGFGTKLMLKDLGLATQVAKELHVGLPITSAGKELYQLADLRGLGDKDFGVMLQFLRGK